MKVPYPKNEKTLIDPNYRYQRETIVMEKSGQFYVLKNLITVVKDLDLNINDIVKYLQKKVNQPITLDKAINLYKLKSGANDIDKYFDQYIVENLVCKKCNLPEIKSNKICSACSKN
jgi:translation initiation factor 2 beta subunit (eIF-2beta)/eIF-5